MQTTVKQPNLTVKFDGFDISLHKITVFHLVLLSYSVYTDANHGTLKIAFSTFITFVV